mmetsp:Transcript_12691/g.41021  ORF Transcript_12691/g.41021 Transcript_12691/m.41021 type:complete len:327 (+) Transcript_12691:1265-2245(+)
MPRQECCVCGGDCCRLAARARLARVLEAQQRLRQRAEKREEVDAAGDASVVRSLLRLHRLQLRATHHQLLQRRRAHTPDRAGSVGDCHADPSAQVVKSGGSALPRALQGLAGLGGRCHAVSQQGEHPLAREVAITSSVALVARARVQPAQPVDQLASLRELQLQARGSGCERGGGGRHARHRMPRVAELVEGLADSRIGSGAGISSTGTGAFAHVRREEAVASERSCCADSPGEKAAESSREGGRQRERQVVLDSAGTGRRPQRGEGIAHELDLTAQRLGQQPPARQPSLALGRARLTRLIQRRGSAAERRHRPTHGAQHVAGAVA